MNTLYGRYVYIKHKHILKLTLQKQTLTFEFECLILLAFGLIKLHNLWAFHSGLFDIGIQYNLFILLTRISIMSLWSPQGHLQRHIVCTELSALEVTDNKMKLNKWRSLIGPAHCNYSIPGIQSVFIDSQYIVAVWNPTIRAHFAALLYNLNSG